MDREPQKSHSVQTSIGSLSWRLATPSDAAAVVALVNGAYRGESGRRGWTTEADLLGGQRLDHEMVLEMIEADAGRESGGVLLADFAESSGAGQESASLVGCVHIKRLQPDSRAAYFGMLTTDVDRQKLGIGDFLLKKAEEFAAKELGAERMEMQVISLRRELIAWYERRGYVRTGKTSPFPYGQLRFGEPLRPDLEFIWMSKALPAPLTKVRVGRLFAALVTCSILCGLGAWAFLAGLNWVTSLRIENQILFLTAPLIGLLTGWLFLYAPAGVRHGNMLIVNLLRRSGDDESRFAAVPGFLAPLIVAVTWLAHLAGLSVGREGTALQMGGGFAAHTGRLLKVENDFDQRLLLQVGVAGGLAAVFGVPLAGAIFALECSRASFFHPGLWKARPGFLHQGPRKKSRAPLLGWAAILSFFVCLAGGGVADQAARFLGTHHVHFPSLSVSDVLSARVVFVSSISAVLFGLMSWLFLWALHYGKIQAARWIKTEWFRPVAFGFVYAPMAFAPPFLHRFAGLGTAHIEAAFQEPSHILDWLGKFIYTVFAIAGGFKGGEVTPLFFMGATLGSALAGVFDIAPQVLAAVGLVAVFGATAGVPFACSVMAAELFGAPAFLIALPSCLIADWVCRHTRLYDTRPEI